MFLLKNYYEEFIFVILLILIIFLLRINTTQSVVAPPTNICDNDMKCEPILLSKPALEEFKKSELTTGIIPEDVYSMKEEGYVWRDAKTGNSYDGVLRLFHDKEINWVRIALRWDDASLNQVTQVLHDANNFGFNLAVVFYLSDDIADYGNQNEPSAFKGIYNIEEKARIVEDYTYKISEYFKRENLDIKLYEIGNEVDFGIAGIFNKPDYYKTDYIDYLKNHIWPNETKIIQAAIKGIKKSNNNTKVLTHITNWWEPDFTYNFFKFMLDHDVELDFFGISYYPTLPVDPEKQKISYFLNNINRVSSLTGKYFVISEYAYPSSPNIPDWLSIFRNPVEGYPFTPEGQANWLSDFFSAIKNNPYPIINTFYFLPEAANDAYGDFCALFYSSEKVPAVGENYLNCPKDCCSLACTATYSLTFHNECDDYNGCCIEDVNVKDGINIVDISIVAKAYGSKPWNSNWNPRADLDGNNIVNIVDIVKVARMFGKSRYECTIKK